MEVKKDGHDHHDHDHEGHSHGIDGKAVFVCGVNITPLALLCALGFHSIFEGIAMGLMTTLNSYINMMIGVAIHHTVASISLGVSLSKHPSKSKIVPILIIVGFSLF